MLFYYCLFFSAIVINAIKIIIPVCFSSILKFYLSICHLLDHRVMNAGGISSESFISIAILTIPNMSYIPYMLMSGTS